MEEVQTTLKEKGYTRNNTFNMDESGLFYRCMPNRTYSILHENLTGGVLYFEIEIRPVKNSNNAQNCAPDVVS
jgi:hypothetical protein